MYALHRLAMEIEICADGSRVVLAVAGEIDAASAPDIEATLEMVAGWSETTDVIVQLDDVTFINSIGITALLRSRERFHKADIGFEVRGACGLPARVLELTGVLPHLDRVSRQRASRS